MFAVVKVGSRQYKAVPGEIIRVDLQEALPGDVLALRNVLGVAHDDGRFEVGAPLVEGAAVEVEVINIRRDRTILVFKKRRRKNSRRKNGHRAIFTELKIRSIALGGAEVVESKRDPLVPDEIFAPLKAAQGKPDPLHILVGVGKDGERALYASGIYHFRQLAAIKPGDDEQEVDAGLLQAASEARRILQLLRGEQGEVNN